MQAMVFIYSDGEAAASKAGALAQLGWHVVFSGPDSFTELRENDGTATAYDGGWVVLASKTGITTVV